MSEIQKTPLFGLPRADENLRVGVAIDNLSPYVLTPKPYRTLLAD